MPFMQPPIGVQVMPILHIRQCQIFNLQAGHEMHPGDCPGGRWGGRQHQWWLIIDVVCLHCWGSVEAHNLCLTKVRLWSSVDYLSTNKQTNKTNKQNKQKMWLTIWWLIVDYLNITWWLSSLSSGDHMMMILWSSVDHLTTNKQTNKQIMVVDYLIINCWLYDDHLAYLLVITYWSFYDHLLIIFQQTNKGGWLSDN